MLLVQINQLIQINILLFVRMLLVDVWVLLVQVISIQNKKIYGTDFPVITINDIVNAQVNLLDHFEIKKLFSVVGGSMGGMQVLQFVSNFPEKTKTAVPIACTSSHSAQNIAFNELGRQAITADHNWSDGKYSLKNIVLKKVWLLQEWLLTLLIVKKRSSRKIWKKTYKKEMILNLVLMLIFK